jgi:hypothetical protein
MPGGPARSAHAVDKTFGGPSTEPHAAAESDEVMKAFDTLAAVAKSEPERLELANKKLSFMHSHGVGAIEPISGRPRG